MRGTGHVHVPREYTPASLFSAAEAGSGGYCTKAQTLEQQPQKVTFGMIYSIRDNTCVTCSFLRAVELFH